MTSVVRAGGDATCRWRSTVSGIPSRARPGCPRCGSTCDRAQRAQPRSAESGRWSRRSATDAGVDPCAATSRTESPSRRQIAALTAPQNRAALSATTSMTGWRSVGELAITRRISAVAVCCSSASFRLVEQPDVLDGDDRLGGEGLEQCDLLGPRTAATSRRATVMVPIGSPSRSIGTARTVRKPASIRAEERVLRIRRRCPECGQSRRSRSRARWRCRGSVAIGNIRCTAASASSGHGRGRHQVDQVPSNRKTFAFRASHSRTALSAMASKTG